MMMKLLFDACSWLQRNWTPFKPFINYTNITSLGRQVGTGSIKEKQWNVQHTRAVEEEKENFTQTELLMGERYENRNKKAPQHKNTWIFTP